MQLALSQKALLSLAKCTGNGLAMAASPTASSALVLEPRRPARTPARAVPLDMPEGKGATSINSSSEGQSDLAQRWGSHMPNVEVEKCPVLALNLDPSPHTLGSQGGAPQQGTMVGLVVGLASSRKALAN